MPIPPTRGHPKAETSLYDVWLSARRHALLVLGLPLIALVAIPVFCSYVTPCYGYKCLVKAPQLGSNSTRGDLLSRRAKEYLTFVYIDDPSPSAEEATLKRVAISNGLNLISMEVWGKSLQAAKARCEGLVKALGARFRPTLESYLKAQQAVLTALETEVREHESLLRKTTSDASTQTDPWMETLFAMERNRVRAHMAALRAQIDTYRYSLDPINTFNFQVQALGPIDEKPVFPQTLAMSAIGIFVAFAFAVLVALLIEALKAAREDRS